MSNQTSESTNIGMRLFELAGSHRVCDECAQRPDIVGHEFAITAACALEDLAAERNMTVEQLEQMHPGVRQQAIEVAAEHERVTKLVVAIEKIAGLVARLRMPNCMLGAATRILRAIGLAALFGVGETTAQIDLDEVNHAMIEASDAAHNETTDADTPDDVENQ